MKSLITSTAVLVPISQMKRRDFIGLSAIGILALNELRANQWPRAFSDRDLLIGKSQDHLVGEGYKLHRQVKPDFDKMCEAASKSGFKIEVVSAFRSFQRQKQIFEGKYKRFTAQGLKPEDAIAKIIEYSTIPGTSRHHWGTDIDLIDGNATRPESVLQARHFHGEGPFCKFKEWMNEHAESFGFYEVYTDLPERKGFKYEPWHFSYAPVSIGLLKAYRELDIKQIMLEEDVLGATYFTDNFIEQYKLENVLDINPDLL